MLSNLFKKRKAIDFGHFVTDVHSHLIPGIDDGVKTLAESIDLIKYFERLGYKKLITTPHIMSDTYPNTPEIIQNGLKKVKEEVEKNGIDLEIEAAAEYYYDEHFLQLIQDKNILTFSGNHVLFEFSFASKPKGVKNLIFELKSNGYIPVLAHFERYPYYHGDLNFVKSLREQGVKIQLNLVSFSGRYGKSVTKQAKALVNAGLVDVVGSDCHRLEHLHLINKEAKNPYFHKLAKMDLLNFEL